MQDRIDNTSKALYDFYKHSVAFCRLALWENNEQVE